MLLNQHLLAGVPFPGGCDGGIDQGVTPGRQDRVVDIADQSAGYVQAYADEGAAVFGDVPVCRGQVFVVVQHHRARDQPAAVLRLADADLALHRAELVQIGRELPREGRVPDAQPRQAVREGLDQGDQVRHGDARARERGDGEAGVGEVPDAHGARVDKGRERLVVQRNGLVEGVLADVGIGEGQVEARHGRGRVRLGSHRPYHAVGAAAAAAQRPVQVSVLVVARGRDEAARAVDDLPAEDLVSGETVPRRQGRVAASLAVSACRADGGTLAADELEAARVGGLVDLEPLHARSQGDSGARVAGVVVVVELDALEVVRPDAESAGARGLALVVMAGVAHNHADVVRVGELQRLGDVMGRGDIDGVDDVVTQRARLGDRVEGVAGAIGEPGRHDGGRRFIAVGDSLLSCDETRRRGSRRTVPRAIAIRHEGSRIQKRCSRAHGRAFREAP